MTGSPTEIHRDKIHRAKVENRVAGIDVLRGISIISVVLMHINQRAPIEKTVLGQWLHPQLLSCLFRSGYFGVIVFFVISGFLITSSSIKRWGSLQNVEIRKFYSIRFARIAPCLVFLLIVLSCLHVFGFTHFIIDPHKTSLPRAIFSALTFHLNWLEAQKGYLPGSWDVLWSLSVEEAFYLVFPIACAVLRSRLLFVAALSLFVILGPFARIQGTNEIWQDHSYLSCVDGIALGCLTALFTAKARLSSQALKWVTRVGYSLFVICVLFKKQIFKLGLADLGLNVTLLEVATALVIISIQGRAKLENLTQGSLNAVLRWFGRNSYEVYLTHIFVIVPFIGTILMAQDGSPMILLGCILILCLSGGLGYLVARYFSEPANTWIRARVNSGFIKAPAIQKARQ